MGMTEREIQRFLVSALRKIGFTVCVTSTNKSSRCTHGTPDLFVHIHDGLWLGLEVKSETGGLSEEQSKLEKSGAVHIIRSIEEGVKLAMDKRNTRLLKIRGMAS